MRIWQQRYPIFSAKIRQSFTFGALWRTDRVLCLCIRCASTCLYSGESKPTKASNILMHVAYTGKSMSLPDMDWNKHTAIIMQTIWHEYAYIVVALSAYPHHKVKSTHNYERVTPLTMGVHHTKCTITHKQADIYVHTHAHIHHAQCKHMELEDKVDIANVPRVWLSKVHEI